MTPRPTHAHSRVLARANATGGEDAIAEVAVMDLCAALAADAGIAVVRRRGGPLRQLAHVAVDDEDLRAAFLEGRLDRVVPGGGGAGLDASSFRLPGRAVVVERFTLPDGAAGAFILTRDRTRPFSEAERDVVADVVRSAAHGLERAWREYDRELKLNEALALRRATSELMAALSTGRVLDVLSAQTRVVLGAAAVVVLVEEAGLPVTVAACDGHHPDGRAAEDLGATLARRFAGDVDGLAGLFVEGAADTVVVPLEGGPGARGWVVATFADPPLEPGRRAGVAQHLADLAAPAWAHAEAHMLARRAARIDELTGCLNRAAFHEQLGQEIERSRRTGEPLSLVMIDLDRFKDINEAYGHLGGDTVLRAVGEVLRAVVRPYDAVARHGGDEFALVLPSTTEQAAVEVADRAVQALDRGRLPDGARLGVSAGAAEWRPGETEEDFVHRADAAQQGVKRSRRGTAAGEQPYHPSPHGGAAVLLMQLAGRTDRREIAEVSTAGLVDALDAEACALVRLDGELLRPVNLARASGQRPVEPLIPVMRSAVELAFDDGRALLLRQGDATVLLAPVRLDGSRWGALQAWRHGTPFGEPHRLLLETVAEGVGRALAAAAAQERRLQAAHLESAAALADVMAGARRPEGQVPAVDRVGLAVAVGRRLGLPEPALRELRLACSLRDVAREDLPAHVAARRPLPAAHIAAVRGEPVRAAALVADMPGYAQVAEILRHHREHYDGSGYPARLRGEEIPLASRILHAVTAYEAMLEGRPYRRAFGRGEARGELERQAGTQFDPVVVEALLTEVRRRA